MGYQHDLFAELKPKKLFNKKILVIDSHKSSNDKPAENLHWQNARMIADALDADLIWSIQM